MDNKQNLPLTEATINEVWRFCNVAPIFVPRRDEKEVEVSGSIIPENSLVLGNTTSVHMDPGYWGDPETFRPERFLREGAYEQDERNIPFGIGRRRCLGEKVARMETFLCFANLLKHFSFSPLEGEALQLELECGFTNGLKPFTLNIDTRENKASSMRRRKSLRSMQSG